LNLKPGDSVLDATVGGGGHALEILKKISPGGHLLGIDWDKGAIERAEKKLAKYKNSVILKQGNYTDAKKISYGSRNNQFSAILLDLGLSRDQLEDESRGFSFQNLGSLDMRFSDQGELTTSEIVNTWPEDDLTHIFRVYGEERHAARVAKLIVSTRERAPIESVPELVALVMRGVGGRGKRHPATRIFQALRIATNRELENIEKALPDLVGLLKKSGRLGVITFHSLEDRIVKQYFKPLARSENPPIKLINKKVIKPKYEEVKRNPAARSAKLRIVEKA